MERKDKLGLQVLLKHGPLPSQEKDGSTKKKYNRQDFGIWLITFKLVL